MDYCSPLQGYAGYGEVTEGSCTPPRLLLGQANDDDDDDIPSQLFSDEEMEKLERLVWPTLAGSPRGHADSCLSPMQEPYYAAGGPCSSTPGSQTKGTKPRTKKKRNSVSHGWTARAPTSDWGQAAATTPLEDPLHLPQRVPYTTTPSPFHSPCSLSSHDSFDSCQDYELPTIGDGMGPAVAGDLQSPRRRKPKTDLKKMTAEERKLHVRQINLSPSRRSREKKKASMVALEDTIQRLEIDNCRLQRKSQELEDTHAIWKTIGDIMSPWLPRSPTALPVGDDLQAPLFPPTPGRNPF
ncbi:uncharacterized protein LOC143032124 [Oratosquilla oratoria]|uniref:uncharacterized protein LOC143032124 n=1 Tax=Oratosquilla oratoria TaxID=337810 RepID=UPI003F760A73